MSMRMLFAVPIAVLLLLSGAHHASADLRTFEKEYTYRAGEEDSKNSSRTIALREVKRLLLEELGTYLESKTDVKNFQLAKDHISALTAGIVRTEIVAEKWDGNTYYLKARMTVDPDNVIQSIEAILRDQEKTRELEEARRRSETLLRENEQLKKELQSAEGERKRKITEAYDKNIKELDSTEWFEKGYSLGMSGNYKEAIAAFDKAVRLNPKHHSAYFLRGLVYNNLGNFRQAIKDYDRAITLNPKTAAVYFVRGLAYNNLGNYHQAIRDFDKAITLNPKVAEPYNSRGIAYNNLGNHQQAIKDYDRAITLNPRLAEAYYNRGRFYSSLGNFRQAIIDYDKAIDLNPRYAEAYAGRGFAYSRLGNHQQDIEDLKVSARLGYKTAQDALKKKGIKW